MNAGWGDFTLEIWWISPWNLVDFNHEIWWISPRFDLWNPPKIIKASVSAKTLQFDECRVGAMTKDFMKSPDFTLKSGGFHLWNPAEFTQISSMKSTQNYKSKCFSKNSSVWWMQSGGYDQGFHEICRISPWNPHEICRISKLWAFAWWSSIGLSFFERPNIKTVIKYLSNEEETRRKVLVDEFNNE